MGDSKRKLPNKNVKKVRGKKIKTKNYIKENVKNLKQISRNRSKSDDEDDHIRHSKPSISYAKRLKIATSTHLKLLEKLAILKNENALAQKDRKNVNVFTMQSKRALNESNSSLPNIKVKKPVKTKLRSIKEAKNEFVKYNYFPRPNINDTNTTLTTKHETTKEVKDKNIELNKKLKVERYYEEPSIPTEAHVSRVQIVQAAKGFKSEGCQVRMNNSSESIDSSNVIRFPRQSDGKSKEQLKKPILCEKGLQTDSKQISQLPVNPTSTMRNRLMKPISSQPKTTLKEKNSLLPRKNDTNNREQNKIKQTSTNNQLSKIPINKANLKTVDEKANILLNEIISKSKVDIKKLFGEVGKVQRTSPFARHQTVFEKRSPDQIKKETSINMKNNPNRVPGTIPLPDHKRKEYLAQIKKRHMELLRELNSLPINSKSEEVRKKKVKIGQSLNSLDIALKLFSKDQLIIDLNVMEQNK